jgi:hypothetical protein
MPLFYHFYFYIHEYYNVLGSILATSLYPSMVSLPNPVHAVEDVRNSDSRRHPCSYIDEDQVVVPPDHIQRVEKLDYEAGDTGLVLVDGEENTALEYYDRKRESERE